MKTAKIAVISSYLVGLTMRTTRFPAPGETLIAGGFTQFHGGKGSNQAVGCARLGAEVRFASCVGADAMGDNALKLYAAENVDAVAVSRLEDAPTGVGFIIVSDTGENIITLDLGACLRVSPEYVDTLAEMIGWADMVLCQLEIPVESVERVAELAREKNVKMLLNPAPYQPLTGSLIRNVSLLTPNETEARAIIGLSVEEKFEPDDAARRILAMGAERVVITLGSKGAYYAERGGASGFLPAKSVCAVDTTGAGDTFTAALAVSLSEGNSLPDAVTFAQRAAAIAVTRYGVIESLPYRKELT